MREVSIKSSDNGLVGEVLRKNSKKKKKKKNRRMEFVECQYRRSVIYRLIKDLWERL